MTCTMEFYLPQLATALYRNNYKHASWKNSISGILWSFTGSCSFYWCATTPTSNQLFSLSIVYLVLLYYVMTRADTAERNLILPKKTNSTPATSYAYTFYSPGSMPVILFIINITVDDLHYGIYSQIRIYICKYTA